MIEKLKILFLGLLFCTSLRGQETNDTIMVYRATRIVPRFGINVQKGYGIECGLFLNNFYARFPRPLELGARGFVPYASHGFFISSELYLRNFEKIIIAPKLGWELGVIGETHGSFFGIEFINYTNFEDYSPALMLKIGIPLMWLNIGYGYTMFFENTLKEQIGKHRITMTYTLNRKANKEYKRMQKNLKERISSSQKSDQK